MLIAPNIAVGAAIMAEYLDARTATSKMRWVTISEPRCRTICEKGESRDGAPDASAEGDLTALLLRSRTDGDPGEIRVRHRINLKFFTAGGHAVSACAKAWRFRIAFLGFVESDRLIRATT